MDDKIMISESAFLNLWKENIEINKDLITSIGSNNKKLEKSIEYLNTTIENNNNKLVATIENNNNELVTTIGTLTETINKADKKWGGFSRKMDYLRMELGFLLVLGVLNLTTLIAIAMKI